MKSLGISKWLHLVAWPRLFNSPVLRTSEMAPTAANAQELKGLTEVLELAPENSCDIIKTKNKQLCCNKDHFHGFYNDEFLLHVPILNKFSIREDEESVTRCTICLTEWRLFSHLVPAFPLKYHFQELKTCLLRMLWTFWTQYELNSYIKQREKGSLSQTLTILMLDLTSFCTLRLWSQCAKQTNLAVIIQRKDGLECEVSMSLSSDLTLTLLQNYNLWSPGYILDLVYALKESSYAKFKSYSTDIAPSSYAKA